MTDQKNRAYALADGWASTNPAKAILSKIDYLEHWSDKLAGWGMDHIREALGEELLSLECELDSLRDKAIDQALLEWPDDGIDEDYVRDHLDDVITKTAAAIQQARKSHAGASLREAA